MQAMRITTTLATLLAAAGMIACSDSTPPIPAGTTPVTFSVCSVLPGVNFGWFAYQNEGGPWTEINVGQDGRTTFNATNKVSVAMAISLFGTSFTQIVNATAAELQAAGQADCLETFGSRTMTGTIAGVTGEQFARITAGFSFDGVDINNPNWLLEDLPARALDIVATRYPTFSTQPADRVVIRRNVTPNNASVAALDFNSATESAALEGAIATFTGLGSAATLDVSTGIITANGTEHELMEMFGTQVSNSQAVSYVSVPASLRLSSDKHVIFADLFDVDGSRSVQHYYTAPSAKTLAFGPMVPTPTITNVATSPYVRPRAQVASQAQYDGGVLVQFSRTTGTSSANIVAVLTTAGFTGGVPTTWDVSVPDMTAGGYSSGLALGGTDYNWSITAVSGSGISLMGVPAADGTTILTATRGDEEILFGLRARKTIGSK